MHVEGYLDCELKRDKKGELYATESIILKTKLRQK